MTMIANQSDVQEAATIIEASKVPVWRLRILSILQLLGILAAVFGSVEIFNLASIIAPDVGRWLAISGAALHFSAKPVIALIGDYMDDGVKNNSFKLDQ